MRSLFVESLQIRSFRNIQRVDLSFGSGFNVLSGDNGQGKTNVLEAIYTVATSKSFRATKPADIIERGRSVASVRALVAEGGHTREQSLGLKAGARLAKIEGKRPPSLAAYAVRTPVVVFHPGEMALSMGGGAERRKLLDRISLYRSASSASDLDMYGRAVRERQKALEARGPNARDLPEWEELMVRHGLAVMNARGCAAIELSEGTKRAFAEIAAPGTTLSVDYAAGAPEDADRFRSVLAQRRVTDAHRRSASVGPHRDDLALVMNGQPARGFASQGQHRAIVLAMKSAEIDVIGRSTGVRPILLLDDVSSELDRERTSALFEHLQAHDGQVFLTTTRPELIEISELQGVSRSDFAVQSGRVEAVGGSVRKSLNDGSVEQA